MCPMKTIGIQSGSIDFRNIAGYIMDLLEKCHEVHTSFKKCSDSLKDGRQQLDRTEQAMTGMQTTLTHFSTNVDSLGVHLLQDNAALAQRTLHIDRLQREIAKKKERLVLVAANKEPHEVRAKERQLNDLKEERAKLELQLTKVNHDIDATYEDMFETQEKLFGIKMVRDERQTEAESTLARVKDKCAGLTARKQLILSCVNTANTVNLSDLYVSPAEFRRMQTEIEDFKHKHVQIERHIQMQLEEREFLRSTADDIVKRVFDLERKVRKETGDHGWDKVPTTEPNWYKDLGSPSIWFTSPSLTVDQLKAMRENQMRKIGYAQIMAENAEESTSGGEPEEIVVIDLMNGEKETSI